MSTPAIPSSTYEPANALTPQQLQVIACLAHGQSISAAARTCHLHRSTIYDWQHREPDFAQALRDARNDRANQWHARADQEADAAFAFIRATMDNENVPYRVRLQAAFFIAKEALKPPAPPTPDELRHERIIRINRRLEHDEQAEAENLAANHNAQQQQQQRQPTPHPTKSDTPTQLSNPTKSDTPTVNSKPSAAKPQSQPIVRPSPRIGRNDKCPCGSTRKYKQCCLNKKAAA